MASWVTHLMLADRVLKAIPELDRHSFCVGNIAPDCNVENEDWTEFTPSREVTHWMSAEKKTAADCERFYDTYVTDRGNEIKDNRELSFLLGYYAHLIADAQFQRFVRDEKRISAAWARLEAHPLLSTRSTGMSESWDSIKLLIGKRDWMKDIRTIEAEYLETHPDSGYLTEILELKTFPDYIDYLPKGAIVRKIGIMGYLPAKMPGAYPFIAISREEYSDYLNTAALQIIRGITNR